jgi:anti-sigma regulatory factor (Ser/Thr protein kinase)
MDESESDESLYLTLASEIERVPVVMERVSQFARRQGFGNSDALLLVVRELLMNAIVHGNEGRTTRMALVRVAYRLGRFEVQVDDEGEGFDVDSLVLNLPDDPTSLVGRGLVLVNELADELSFEHGGSRVRAIVDPSGKKSASGHESAGYAGAKSNREEVCTNPMVKSL